MEMEAVGSSGSSQSVHWLRSCLTSRGEKEVSACWEELELEGAYTARELWSHQGQGSVEGKLAATLPAHGAKVYKLCK